MQCRLQSGPCWGAQPRWDQGSQVLYVLTRVWLLAVAGPAEDAASRACHLLLCWEELGVIPHPELSF